MTELSKLLSFQQKFTTPYSPEINGLTECFNKTLASMLSPFMETGEFTEWEKNLPSVVFAYNTSVQASTKEIPYFLTFGRDPILPMDVALNLPSTSLSADLLANRLKTAFENAQVRLSEAQQEQKEHFDKGRKHISHKVGDLVLYEVPTRKKGQPDKFQPKCKGPYKIVSKISGYSYLIEDLDPNKPKREIVGVRRLIPYIPAEAPENLDIGPVTVIPESEDSNAGLGSDSFALQSPEIRGASLTPDLPAGSESTPTANEKVLSNEKGASQVIDQPAGSGPRRSARVANRATHRT
jgi:hypothetical protein